MTVNQARKTLGRDAESLSDQELQTEIEMADLLKDLFFQWYFEQQKKGASNAK